MKRKMLRVALGASAFIQCMTSPMAGEITEVVLWRGSEQIQASADRLSWTLFPYSAGTRLWSDNPFAFTGGFLVFPSEFFLPLSLEDNVWGTYSVYGRPESPGLGYPAGNYSFGLNRAGGGVLEFAYDASAGSAPPYHPLVTNYGELQQIDPATPVTVQWIPEARLAPEARMDVEVIELREDGIYPTVFRRSAVDPTAALPESGETTIPAGLFKAGARYRMHISFAVPANVIRNPQDLPGAVLYTTSRARTIIDLGLATDEPRLAQFAWSVDYDLVWNTSAGYFLSAPQIFPVSWTTSLLFSVNDWAEVPAEQVLASGPDGSGFENTSGRYLAQWDEDTLWFVIPSNSIADPLPGDYVVEYRSLTYSLPASTIPGADRNLLAHPTVALDAAGRLTGIQWEFRRASDGARVDPSTSRPLLQQSILLAGEEGVALAQFDNLTPDVRSVHFEEGTGPLWNSVQNMSIRSEFSDTVHSLIRYRISHLDHPEEVYFNEGVLYGDWLLAPWFGWLTAPAWPWIWNPQTGFLFMAGDGDRRIIAFHPALGWIYSEPRLWPFIYHFQSQQWQTWPR